MARETTDNQELLDIRLGHLDKAIALAVAGTGMHRLLGDMRLLAVAGVHPTAAVQALTRPSMYFPPTAPSVEEFSADE